MGEKQQQLWTIAILSYRNLVVKLVTFRELYSGVAQFMVKEVILK